MTVIDDIRAFAESQGGVISTVQCLRLGATATDLVRFTRDGVLVNPFRGAYITPHDDADDSALRHLRLCAAGRLIYRDGVLGSVSVIAARELPTMFADLSRPILHHGDHRGVGVKGVVLRRARPVEPVESPHGPTHPLAVALLDHARDNGILAGVVAGDAALHGGLVTREDLASALVPVRKWPGGAIAAAALTFLDGRCESPGESWTRFQLAMGGIETIPQVEIRDRSGRLVGRVDMLVTGTRVIVEFDGQTKYASGDPAVLWAEKKREDWLRRLGYTVIRITWADLHKPGLVVALVRQAIAA